MTPIQINFLKSLDKDSQNGDIQSVLLRKDLNKVPFEEALKFILIVTLQHKEVYKDENQKLTKILKDRGLYTSEILFGGE
jgi:hypothetical protein